MATSYTEHIKYFGSPEAYATEIMKRENAGQSLSDPEAANSFRLANPQYFRTGVTTPTAAKTVSSYQPTRQQTEYQSQVGDILSQLRERVTSPQDITQTPYYKQSMEGLQAQQDIASRASLEAMNARNILNSSITSDRDSQIRAQILAGALPGIYQTAQQMQQAETGNLLNMLNAYQGLEQQEYQRGTTQEQQQYERQRQEEQDRLSAESARIEQEQTQLQNAWNRVKNIGYVDNIASITLGLPVGTLSADAQKAVEDRNSRLQIARENNASAMARTQYTQSQINSRGNTDNGLYKQAITFAQKDPRWEYVETTDERNNILSEYLNMLGGDMGNGSQEKTAPTDVDLFNDAMPRYINAVNSGTPLKQIYEEIDSHMENGEISNSLGEIMKAELKQQFE